MEFNVAAKKTYFTFNQKCKCKSIKHTPTLMKSLSLNLKLLFLIFHEKIWPTQAQLILVIVNCRYFMRKLC